MDVIKLKHDEFFKTWIANIEVAKEFLNQHLPVNVKNHVNMETLKLENSSFIEEDLKKSLSDVLFSAEISGKTGYLYILLENQSTHDPLIAFRLLRYMVNILIAHTEKHGNNKKFPLIYPLVFSSAEGKFKHARNIWDLFSKPKLMKEFWLNDFQMVELSEVSDEDLRKRNLAGAFQYFMKHAREKELLKIIDNGADYFRILAKRDDGEDKIKSIVIYILTKFKKNDIMKAKELIKSIIGSEQGERIMGSAAESFYNEGKTEGILTGKIEGKVETTYAIAKNLLNTGVEISLIAKATGLSQEQILKLKNEISS